MADSNNESGRLRICPAEENVVGNTVKKGNMDRGTLSPGTSAKWQSSGLHVKKRTARDIEALSRSPRKPCRMAWRCRDGKASGWRERS